MGRIGYLDSICPALRNVKSIPFWASDMREKGMLKSKLIEKDRMENTVTQ